MSFFGKFKKDQAEEAQEATQQAFVPQQAQPGANLTDDAQLVAVIMAAIAAMTGQAASGLIIRKIVRTAGPTNAWYQAGAQDRTDSRKF